MRFDEIDTPPQPIVIRWTSCLKAATYYASSQGGGIVMQLNGNGLPITRAQANLQNANITADLVAITPCYCSLVTIILRMEISSYTIREAFYA